MGNRKFYSNVNALREFQVRNPFTKDKNSVSRFIGSVLWIRKGHPNYHEKELTIHWNFSDFYGPRIVVDSKRMDCGAELFFTSFDPEYQFYIFDDSENVLRIKHDEGLYEVIITPIRGRDD